MITQKQLERILVDCGTNAQRAPVVATENLPILLECLTKYQINTKLRLTHFLSQVLHESGNFRYNEEIASGKAYEGRRDLGNVQAGDGVRFKGRGYIQLTGRTNYTAYAKFLGVDVVANPQLVGTKYKADAAGWFWQIKKLNAVADLGSTDDVIRRVTRIINGGFNGLEDRIKKFRAIEKILVAV